MRIITRSPSAATFVVRDVMLTLKTLAEHEATHQEVA